MKPKLTGKQEKAVIHYIENDNKTAAYKHAYSTKNMKPATINIRAFELFEKSKIRVRVEELKKPILDKLNIDTEFVLNGIVQTIKKCEGDTPKLDKEGEETGEYVFKANETLKGYELLGRHLKMFTDKVETTGKDGKDLYPDMTEEAIDKRLEELRKQEDE